MKRLIFLALALVFSCIVFVQWGGFSNDFGISIKAVSIIKDMKKVEKN